MSVPLFALKIVPHYSELRFSYQVLERAGNDPYGPRLLCVIDTLDLFAEDGRNAAGDGIDLARLFSVGRPLWGAYIREPSLGLARAINLAYGKVGCGRDNSAWGRGIRPVEFLALLSYRIGLYISRREMAEELASEYLHYFVSITDDRKSARTRAPSEPILAHASAVQTLRKPESRSTMMGHFYSSITDGSIHVEDMGEFITTCVLLFTLDKMLDPRNYRPIDLTTFLETFLAPAVSSMLTHMKTSPELKELLEGGSLVF